MPAAYFGAITAITLAILVSGFNDPKSDWAVWVCAILFVMILGLVSFAFDSPKDAARVTRILKRRDGPMLYTATVSRVLNGMSRILTPENAHDTPPPNEGFFSIILWLATPRAVDAADLVRLRSNPWSWPTLDFALKLAFIYPLFLTLLQWSITGSETGFGSLVLFMPEQNAIFRFAAVGLILAVILFRLQPSFFARQQRTMALSWTVVLLLAFAVAFLNAIDDSTMLTVVLAVAFLGALTLSGTSSFPVTCALAIECAVSFSGIFVGTLSFAGVFAGAFVFLLSSIVGRATQARKGMAGYYFMVVTILLTSAATIYLIEFQGSTAGKEDVRILVLFLGVFPIVNAVFDYLSYGVTIWLVRKGASKQGGGTLLLGAVDVLCAAVIFFMLSASLVAIIEMINWLTGITVFDVATLLDDIKTRPADHWWVSGMIFSTLIPTLVHLIIVALSAITWLPPKARDWFEAGIAAGKDDGGAFQVAALATALTYTAYAAFITFGIWAGLSWLWSVRGPILSEYLKAITLWAELIGAIPAS